MATKQAASEAAHLAGADAAGPLVQEQAASGPPPIGERRFLDAFLENGIPAWKRRDIRQQARWSRTLDPDIAAMRSLSLDAKLRKQWSRNEQRLEQDFWDGMRMEIEREAFFSKVYSD